METEERGLGRGVAGVENCSSMAALGAGCASPLCPHWPQWYT